MSEKQRILTDEPVRVGLAGGRSPEASATPADKTTPQPPPEPNKAAVPLPPPDPAKRLDRAPPQPKKLSWIPIWRQLQMARLRQEHIKNLELKLRVQANLTDVIASVLNAKGGAGKTALTVWTASAIAEVTRQTLVVVDSNNNSGTSAKRLGISRDETLQVREVWTDLGDLDSFRSFIGKLPTSRHGVKAIASDPVGRKAQTGSLTREDFEKIFHHVERNAKIVLLDTGNDMEGAPNTAAVTVSDTLVFVCNPKFVEDPNDPDDSEDSVDICRETMQWYRDSGHADKVDHSVVVVIGVQNKDLPGYRQSFKHHGPMIAVPTDKVVGKNRAVDLDSLRPATYEAFLEVAVAIFEQAEAHKQGIKEAAGAELDRQINSVSHIRSVR